VTGGLDNTIREEWIHGKGEALMSRSVPPGSGSDSTPSGWAEYPNQGELDAADDDIFNNVKWLGLSTYVDPQSTYYTTDNAWSNRPGGAGDVYWPFHPTSTLFGGSWDFGGSSGADGVMGIRFPAQYRWAVLETPNYDLIGRLRVWLPSNEWLIIGNPDDHFDQRFYVQDITTGEVWREYKTGDTLGADEKYLFVQSPNGPVNCARMLKMT